VADRCGTHASCTTSLSNQRREVTGLKVDQLLQSCVRFANSVYWRRDHASFREVDGATMRDGDYRAAGSMRLVRAAPACVGVAPAPSRRPKPLAVLRAGIAPPSGASSRADEPDPARSLREGA
jgi:hypothetical protein